MSEEEKKAIEVMKSIEFDIYEWWYDGKRIDIEIDSDIANKSLQTILNLIEKQNNRLEQLEKERDYYFKQYQYHLKQNESLTREFSDSIPKSVIREELRTLKNMLPTALHETSRAVFNGEIALLERILGEE